MVSAAGALRGQGADRAALVARIGGAGLLVASGAIHLDLYVTSYGRIPTIGSLFLAQAVGAFALGAWALASRGVLVPLAGSLLALATLGGYVLSLLVSLFGFHEIRTTAGIVAAVVEIGAASALGAAAARAAGLRWPLVGRDAAALAGAAALAVSLALAFETSPPAAAGVVVRTATLPRYGSVLVSPEGASLYLLSSEGHGRIVCTGACLSIWPPLLVAAGTRPAGAGPLGGRLGAVRGPNGAREVTYNGYPLYRYAGDGRPGETSGEGIASFGGTWYLVRAGARDASATPVRQGQ